MPAMTVWIRLCCQIGVILVLAAAAQVCRADTPLAPFRPGNPADEGPELPAYLPAAPGKEIVLPPPPVSPDSLAAGPLFVLNKVTFEGNAVFADDELARVAAPFIGKPVSLADLEEIRYRLTRTYVDNGYINSGALLKQGQNVDDGIVSFNIVEGRLKGVAVSGNGRLRPEYVRDRILPDPGQPFNVNVLQERFQLLLQDPLIEKMDGRIQPGAGQGEAVLDLDVVRARPYRLKFTADNHGSPGTGSLRGTLGGALSNLTGFGDRLDLALGGSQGREEYNLGFTLPLNAAGTRIALGASLNETAVIEAPLDSVDIESESNSFELNVTHRFLNRLSRSFEAGVTLAARRSKTWLSDVPFSFSRGAEDGKARVTALRFIQSYVDRQPMTALTLRSTLSFGLDLFDATVHDKDLPDGEFIAWLLQAQAARRLGERAGQVILRGALQLADDTLLPLEQFSLGGADTVRGYRENERVRDNGWYLGLEWRCPLIKETGEHRIQAAVFTDIGSAWNKGESRHLLHSAGIGLLWQWRDRVRADLYLAHDLRTADEKYEYDLQDDGIHFSVTIDLF